ncbi:MAG: PQQ-like beta-propeller repeat protein, partial [Rickettsiales bacterium]|nr:PQQ-like beta-propeller repeat protein [Rickettsiales bacterium]
YSRPSENIASSTHLNPAETVSIGGAPDEGYRLSATPIIADSQVFTLDGEGHVEARDADHIGTLLWETELPLGKTETEILGLPVGIGSDTKAFLGGNLAYANGRVFAATGRGLIYALSSKTGEIEWTRSVKIPISSAPVIAGNTLFVVTKDNRLYALNAFDGTTFWTHIGLKETTSVYGSPSPAVEGDVIVVPFSSGELVALDRINGRKLWSDMLISSKFYTGTTLALNDVNTTPVIADGLVYVSGFDGLLNAYELSSGQKLWSQTIDTIQQPWVATNALYLITPNSELVCLHRKEGEVKWIQQLPIHTEATFGWGDDDKGDRINWSGPIMLESNLAIVGSHGKLLLLSPKDGEVSQTVDITGNILLPPVAARRNVYLLSNDAELSLLQ